MLQAPSTGANQWNNLIVPAGLGDVWDPAVPVSILDANGGNEIALDWHGPSFEDIRATTEGVALAPLNQGYFGFGNFDTTLDIYGLDEGGIYDIYVYFTWRWNENSVDYEITQYDARVPHADLDLTLTPSHATADDHANYVEGNNYVVFREIHPDESRHIAIRVFNTADGGINALQIHQVPEPATFALAGFGLVGLWMVRRRRA